MSPRADLHAIRVLQNKKDFTLDSLITAAYDSYLTWFEKPIPALVKAWDKTPASDPLKAKTVRSDRAAARSGICVGRRNLFRLRSRSSGQKIIATQEECRRGGLPAADYIASEAPPEQLLQSLSAASDKLAADFGNWKTPWGEINRFQRLTDDIVHPFSDAGPSIPVGFTSAIWGSLASFGARQYNGSKKIYGTSGNSFVAVVEFGKTVRASAVTAGGESGNPSSKHFNDQARRYSTGDLREVYFYPAQLKGHTEREYHPGN